jgi:hypothetical protein
MLGHGTPQGLIGENGFIINETHADLLRRKKNNVYIWCDANFFINRYQLDGFFTGMIISELGEALLYEVNASVDEINLSNKLFAESIATHIREDACAINDNVLRDYVNEKNAVVRFNRHNLFFKEWII